MELGAKSIKQIMQLDFSRNVGQKEHLLCHLIYSSTISDYSNGTAHLCVIQTSAYRGKY
jgi:hypothetical protein